MKSSMIRVPYILFCPLAILVLCLVLFAESAAGAENVAGPTDTPFLSTSATTDEGLALLSLANTYIALKAIFKITLSSLSYVFYLPKIVYLPVKHAFALLSYLTRLLLQPLQPIIAPARLAVRIIATPIVVPVLLVHKFAVLVYPVYVFVGAAGICGAIIGLLGRRLGRLAVEEVIGVRMRPVISNEKKEMEKEKEKEKEVVPRRVGRLREKLI